MKLSRTQIEKVINVTGESHDKKYLLGECPVCGENEFYILIKEDNHPCGCSRKKQCGWVGNIYTLLKLLNRSREFLSQQEISVFEKLESTLKDDYKEEELIFDLPEIKPPLFWKRIYEDEYLQSRGFSPYQFEKFEVGISRTKKDYISILVRHEGKLVGYVSRSKKSKEEIDRINEKRRERGEEKYLRYDNSITDFSKTLFGIDEVKKGVTTDVILVEGIFSKTKTDVNLCLDELDEMKCLATFGAKLSEHQIELLKRKRVKRLWFWFEADVLNKIKPIVANAATYFDVKVSFLNGIDPNDIDSNRAFQLLDEAKNYLDFNMNFVKSNLK